MKKAKRTTEPNEEAVLLKTLTRPHGETAVAELALLAKAAKSEAVKLAAIKELLDRRFGRPAAAPGESAAGIATYVIVDDGY